MKPLASTLLVSLPAIVLGACQSSPTGADKASYTVDSLENLRTELSAGSTSIDQAVASFKTLVEEGGDMNAEYTAYSKAVDQVTAQRERVRAIHDSLAAHREAFMASWQEGLTKIQDASLRERATERRDKAIAKFDELRSDGAEIRADFDGWIVRLTDARSYLEHDLNPSGVASLEKQVKPIEKGGAEIQESVEDYVAEIDKLLEAIRAAMPPPPAQQ